MTDRDRDPRVVPRAGRGRGEAGGASPAPAGASAPLLAHAFSRAGASVALVARTERDLKAVADALPGPSLVLQRRRDRRGLQRGGRRRHGRPSGAASTCGSATPGSRPIVAGPRETDPSVWRQVLEVNLTGAFLGARAAARGDGRRRAADLHRVGPGRAAAQGAGRLQRLEGRAGRPGQGPRARPGPGRHHRERRRARAGSTRRWPTGGRTTPSSRPRSPGTPRSGAGARPPTSPAPTCSWPPTPSAFVTGTVLNVDGGYLLV